MFLMKGLILLICCFISVQRIHCILKDQKCSYEFGCYSLSVIKPWCGYGLVHSHTTYQTAIRIKSCSARNAYKIHWHGALAKEAVEYADCRNRMTCNVTDKMYDGSPLFKFNVWVMIPENKTYIKLPIVLIKRNHFRELLEKNNLRELLKAKHEIIWKRMETLANSSVINNTRPCENDAQNTCVSEKKEISQIHKEIKTLLERSNVTKSLTQAITILLRKSNFTNLEMNKLLRLTKIMAKSILLEAKNNPMYDRRYIDEKIKLMTNQIWQLLMKFKSMEASRRREETVKGKWSNWGSWSMCPKYCVNSFSTRSRTCFVSGHTQIQCQGHSSEVKKCHCVTTTPKPTTTLPPVIIGNWASWGKWSSCSVSCGLGKQQKYRECTTRQYKFSHRKTVIKCRGSRKKTRACIMSSCEAKSTEYRIFQGSSGSLTCHAKGTSAQNIYWINPEGFKIKRGMKHGRYSVTGDGTLVIKRAHLTDEGTYYCVISTKTGNIVADADIEILNCKDDPCMNGATCIEQRFERKSRPSTYVCACGPGYHGTFCENESKEFKILLIILPLCGGLLLLVAILTIIFVISRKKKKQQQQQKTYRYNGQFESVDFGKIKPTKKRSLETQRVEKRSKVEIKPQETGQKEDTKLNTSIVSADDSFTEIKESELDQILSSPERKTKLRSSSTSYKRSTKPPLQRNTQSMHTRFSKVDYPQTDEEMQKWYRSPQSNYEVYNPPHEINMHQNTFLDDYDKADDQVFYENTSAEGKSARSVEVDGILGRDDDYEEMERPISNSRQVFKLANVQADYAQSTRRGQKESGMKLKNKDFHSIHNTFSPQRINSTDTSRNLGLDQTDDFIYSERNMSNFNKSLSQLEEFGPHDDFGNESLKLNLRNMSNDATEADSEFKNQDTYSKELASRRGLVPESQVEKPPVIDMSRDDSELHFGQQGCSDFEQFDQDLQSKSENMEEVRNDDFEIVNKVVLPDVKREKTSAETTGGNDTDEEIMFKEKSVREERDHDEFTAAEETALEYRRRGRSRGLKTRHSISKHVPSNPTNSSQNRRSVPTENMPSNLGKNKFKELKQQHEMEIDEKHCKESACNAHLDYVNLSPRTRMCINHYQMVYGSIGYKSPRSHDKDESLDESS